MSAAGVARATIPPEAGTLNFLLKVPSKASLDSTAPIEWETPSDTDKLRYFNQARCVCSNSPPAGKERYGLFGYYVTVSTGASRTSSIANLSVDLWNGSNCDQLQSRTDTCTQLDSVATYNTFFNAPIVSVSEFKVTSPKSSTCSTESGDAPLWFLIKPDGANYEKLGAPSLHYDNKPPPLPEEVTVSAAENAIQFDFKLPSAGASDVAYYQVLCSLASDETMTTRTKPSNTNRYDTPQTLCGADLAVPLEARSIDPKNNVTPDAAPAPDANVDAAPDAAAVAAAEGAPAAADEGAPEFAAPPLPASGVDPKSLDGLNPLFVCGEQVGTATSVRAEGLVNGTNYHVVLLAIDTAGNVAGIKFQEAIAPKQVIDAWEDLHDNGSQVEGGFCLMSETYGDGGPITRALRAFRDDTLAATGFGRALTAFYYDHVAGLGAYVAAWWPLRIIAAVVLLPLVGLALAWHLLTLPGLLLVIGFGVLMRRRRARGRVARLAVATAALSIAFLHTAAAHAQSATPYWDTPSFDDEPPIDAQPSWILGIKLGPYQPPIDAQFRAQSGSKFSPFREMFGGYNIVPTLELDRIVFRRYGQLAVGGSLAYYGKSAHAFEEGTMLGDPDRRRSPGDTTSFRLVPMAATAVYRFTYLDDQFGVPVVPYLRGGLSYYMWWIRQPNGDLGDITPNNCHKPRTTPPEPPAVCTGSNKAIGASAGLQLSVGLAIRAERIDKASAGSMHESGIEHAGFYAEYQLAWVDGFGKTTKLDVGDSTWFAGINFEF